MRAILAMIAVLAACGSEPARAPKPVAARPQAPKPSVDPELLRSLAVLATRQLPRADAIDHARADLERGAGTIESYIDGLIAQPAFANDVAPLILLRSTMSAIAGQIALGTLQRVPGAAPIYHVNGPCKPSQAVPVHPWWSLDETLQVCASSYLPDQWLAARPRKAPAGMPEVACRSAIGEESGCGCGPNLIRCLPSKDLLRTMQHGMREEVRQTVAHLTRQGAPIDAAFLSNETFRGRDVELFRQIQIIEERRIANPEAILRAAWTWPAEGKWAPREELAPGAHAGVLTTPQIINFLPDRRQRMTTIYDVMYCDEPDSAGATPELITQIAKNGASFQISQDHWKELAARPICTNCHARLDYGLRFFNGFENVHVRDYFSASQQLPGNGPLYVRNIDDPRGEGPLNPQGFARLAIAQPEHARCLARDFAEYVLADRATADHVDALAALVRPNATTAQAMMKTALLQLVAAWPSLEPALPAMSPSTAQAGEVIDVAPAVRAQLEARCTDCHDGSDANVPDFTQPRMARALALQALDAIAYGTMPKDRPLASAERATAMAPLIGALWTGADAETARGYFVGRMRALPAYRPEVSFGLVHQRAAAAQPTAWRLMEQSTRPSASQANPGMLTGLALQAIMACRQQHAQRAEIDTCIAQALQLSDIAIVPH